MGDAEKLIRCRNVLKAIRQQSADLAVIKKGAAALPDGTADMCKMIASAQDALDFQRRSYPVTMGEAVTVIDGLPPDERKVLLLYYVMGHTVGEIAMELYYHPRTVQRFKERGLKRLTQNERGKTDEQTDSNRKFDA